MQTTPLNFDNLIVHFDAMTSDLRIQGYSVQHAVLPIELLNALLKEVRSLSPVHLKQAGVGREQQHMASADIRRDTIAWIQATTRPREHWLQFSVQLQKHLNRALMLGLFSFESHFSHYAPGAFYKRHVDAFKGQANRILSVVLYLNPIWQPEDGGELVLYSPEADSEQELCRVSPLAGTLVVFLSEDFPHEVLQTNRDRYSIAGWYRVNTSSKGRVDPPS